MKKWLEFWNRTSFYLNRNVYYTGFTVAMLYLLSYLIPVFLIIGKFLFITLIICVITDAFILYRNKRGIKASRSVNDRFSNGDENLITITIQNFYSFNLSCKIIDELPFQFQYRNWSRNADIAAFSEFEIKYTLVPKERGVYEFGNINVYADGLLKLVCRRYTFNKSKSIKVYPSFIQMRRYQLMAIGNHLQQAGLKKLRKMGHSLEFEQIKEYVRGDDYRTINWKATAHYGDLMTNSYTDEKSQQIYCVINKGRVMKMPFEGMTLLDYSINASLVLLNIALHKHDKAGLITFSEKPDSFLIADKKPIQINNILDTLYNQETNYKEPDLEKLFSVIRNKINQRSLLIMFTNFESLESLQREMPFLKRLSHYHLLMVIFFENTELKKITEMRSLNTEDIYIKTIASKYRHEKEVMVKELQKQGIIAVLTSPQNLTINSLNKYLELKNRQSI